MIPQKLLDYAKPKFPKHDSGAMTMSVLTLADDLALGASPEVLSNIAAMCALFIKLNGGDPEKAIAEALETMERHVTEELPVYGIDVFTPLIGKNIVIQVKHEAVNGPAWPLAKADKPPAETAAAPVVVDDSVVEEPADDTEAVEAPVEEVVPA